MQFTESENSCVIKLEKGEEIITTLLEFCDKYNIVLAQFSGIWATNDVTIWLFDTISKEYFSKEFHWNYEICSLMGNITIMDNKPYLHAHIVICDDQNNTYGWHLNKAVISATCEIFLQRIGWYVSREFDEEIGLNLMQF